MTSRPMPMCYGCMHLTDGEGMACDAFPDGIPIDILESITDHRVPYPDGSDGGVVFEQDPDRPVPDFDLYAFGEEPVG